MIFLLTIFFTGSDNFSKVKCSHIVLRVAIGVGHKGGRVYDTFVEDESVAFRVRGYFELFGGWVSVEEVGVDDGDVTAFFERLCDFVEEVLSHDVIVELSGASNVEREASDFAADFALLSFVAVIFGSSGSEFGDGVSVLKFITNQIAGKNHVTNQRARPYTRAR